MVSSPITTTIGLGSVNSQRTRSGARKENRPRASSGSTNSSLSLRWRKFASSEWS